jgi:transcriptional regulator with XRE-family HTH domain
MTQHNENLKPAKETPKKGYKSVVEIVRNLLPDDPEFAKQLAEKVKARCVTDFLIAHRTARGMSQNEIATKMRCTQSRISKLENGTDADLRLGDLQAYASALGLKTSTVLMKEMSLVDSVKLHAWAIHRLLLRIAELSKDDRVMANGARDFFGEAYFNLVDSVLTANEKLTDTLDSAQERGLFANVPDESPPALQVIEEEPSDGREHHAERAASRQSARREFLPA